MSNEQALRGSHTFFIGDRAIIHTAHGYVLLALHDYAQATEAHATLTPDQAEELARDLKAYAAAAREGA
jgi:hypothetical protein